MDSSVHGDARGELATLSRIAREIRSSSNFVDRLDRFTTRVGEVIDLRRCVVIHERRGTSISRGFVYRSAGPSATAHRCAGHSSFGPALGVARYLACFTTEHRFDHGFCWRDDGGGTAPRDVDPRTAELLRHMRGGAGIAGHVHSVVSGADEVETLLQFECEPSASGPHQRLLIGFIAFYLHSTLTLRNVDALQQSCYGINLTGKEKDVLKWVVEGKTSWEIGRILSTSERTVKFHLKNVYSKLNVCNRAQAVSVVNRLGLI